MLEVLQPKSMTESRSRGRLLYGTSHETSNCEVAPGFRAPGFVSNGCLLNNREAQATLLLMQ